MPPVFPARLKAIIAPKTLRQRWQLAPSLRFAFSPFPLLIPGLDVADHDHQVAAFAGRVLDQVFEHRLDGKAGLFEGVESPLGLEVNLGDQLFQAEFPGQFDDLIDQQGAQAPALVIRVTTTRTLPIWRFHPTWRMWRVISPTIRPSASATRGKTRR